MHFTELFIPRLMMFTTLFFDGVYFTSHGIEANREKSMCFFQGVANAIKSLKNKIKG